MDVTVHLDGDPATRTEGFFEAKVFALQDDSVGQVSMNDLEHEIIERTLKKVNGNRRKASEILKEGLELFKLLEA